MRSLRTQVAALVAVVVVVTLGAVGIAFMGVTQVEVGRYLVEQHTGQQQESRALAEPRIRTAGKAGLAGAVRDLAREGVPVLVVEGARVIAAADPEFETAVVTRTPDEATRIEGPNVLLMLKAPPARVSLEGSEVELYLLPRTPDGAGAPLDAREGLVRPIRRGVVLVLLFGALAGIALAFALARRVTGPLEELTRAVRRMESGDLTVRVPVTWHDEVGALGEAFNALATRLERIEQLRREMVSDVAHELRGPITNMRCEVESVQDGLRPLDRKRIDVLHHEILSLGGLVDDLQELAVADAGQLRLELSRFDLLRAATTVANSVGASAEARQVRLELKGNGGEILADERRVTQLIRNLFSNAIVHAPAGTTIEVVAGANPDVARLEIVDHGPGIPADERERIFDRFHRLDPSRSRATGGTGLGLAIAKAIVTAHGGSIGVRETSGGGATFWFTIPRRIAEEPGG